MTGRRTLRILTALPFALLPGACVAGAPAGSSGGGISVEEYESLSPTAPTGVTATREGETVVVSWSPPPRPADPSRLLYDPTIAAYRVYLIGPDLGRTLVAETRRTLARVPAPAGGRAAVYAVTTVTVSGLESGLSLEARVGQR